MTRISARELSRTDGPFGRGVTIVRPEAVPEGSVVTVLRVPPEAAGMRLDRFVQSQLRRTSRTRTQTIVARGAYAPDARRLRSNDRVRAEQCILLWRAPWDEEEPNTTLPVLYEDDDLLAVDKPPYVSVHPTARYHKRTVVKMLEAARPDERFTLSHRIDRETSGVLLLAKNPEADRRVKVQFEERSRVSKSYLAITCGAPAETAFRVELPLELDPTNRFRVKMRVAREGTGVHAATAVEVVGRRSRGDAVYSLVRCGLETGRQHQIRVHLASGGTPLVGDKLYGPDDELFGRGADGTLTEEDRALLQIDRHALHAEVLELDHPTSGARVRIESPFAEDLRAFWEGCDP